MINSNSTLVTGANNKEVTAQVAYSFICINFSEFDPLKLIEPLLETDSSVLTHQDEEGNTLLHYAAYKGFSLTIDKLLQAGADPTIPNNKGDTPLLMINQLSEITKEGNTLLHYAAYKGFSLTVDKLLQKGADPNIRNNKGNTPLLVISQLSKLTKDHYHCIEKLLNFAPDIITLINYANNQGCTALHYAVSFYNIELVKLLLEKGANFNQKNNLRWSPLILFSTKEPNISLQDYEKMCGLFIKKGAKMDERTFNNMSVLHIAARRGVTYLLKHAIQEAKSEKLDINLQDKNAFTPLDYLMKNISLYAEQLNTSQKILGDCLVIKQFIDFLGHCGARYNSQNREPMNISVEWGRLLKPLDQSFTTNDLKLFNVIDGFIQLLFNPAFSQSLEVNKIKTFEKLVLTLRASFQADSTINSVDRYGKTPLDHAIYLVLVQEESNTQYKNRLLSLKSIFSEMLNAGAKLNKTNWGNLSNNGLIKLLQLDANYPNKYYLHSPLLPIPTNPISKLPYSFFPSTGGNEGIQEIQAKNDLSWFLGF